MGSNNQLCSSGGGGVATENGLLAPPHNAYSHPGERTRAMSASGKSSCSAREQLALTLGALHSDTSRSSRDSLHCSSGYSTQTTTPSCSEDTIHSHILKKPPLIYVDYESISLHGDADSVSLHHLHHGFSQSDFDKSSTIPRNSDLGVQFRKFAQSKRPASTVSLLADGEMIGGSHTATIRRKPSSKPSYRRGTISGGVPIPISTPQVPLKAQLSDENLPGAPPGAVLGHNKLCTSTQSLSALPSSHHQGNVSPYYQLVPGQMPIPVPVPTIPENNQAKQQQFVKQFQQNQMAQNQMAQNQMAQNQMAQQLLAQNQLVQHQLAQNQLTQHPLAQNQITQNQLAQHQLVQNQITQNQLAQHQLAQNQLAQNQTYVQPKCPPQVTQKPPLPHHLQQIQNQAQQLYQHDTYQQQNANMYPNNIPSHPQIPAPLPPNLTQQQKQLLYHHQNHHQNQTLPAASSSQGEGSVSGQSFHDETQAQQPTSNQNRDQDEEEEEPRPDAMVSMIRRVKLRRTITNDRSAPMLPPPPANHN